MNGTRRFTLRIKTANDPSGEKFFVRARSLDEAYKTLSERLDHPAADLRMLTLDVREDKPR